MSQRVEFFFDVGSPASYLAWALFGAPMMFTGEHMFFGQDRLDFMREALAASA